MFLSNNNLTVLNGKYIFVDNDFLKFLFDDEINLREGLNSFPKSYLSVDPLIRFEFLRDVYLPSQFEIKNKFISTEGVFHPAISHNEIFDKIKDNALLISKIYAHKIGGGGWSTIDLLLAGRAMHYWNTSAIITGNKKDFPSIIFDTLGIINYETSNNQIKTFCIIKFNKEKFIECQGDLLKICNSKPA